MKGSELCLILLAIIFPPAAALIVGGCCDFLINICLTLLGVIPGHVHAFWLIYLRAKAEEQYQGHYIYAGSGHFQPSNPSYAPQDSRTQLNLQHPPQQHSPPPQTYAQPAPLAETSRAIETAPGPTSTSGTGAPPPYKD